MKFENPMDGGLRCTAHSRSKEQCKRWAIRGGNVCAMHGGKAPQVKAKAEARLAALVDPAIGKLQKLINARSEMVSLAAVKDVLDRNGFKPTDKHELTGKDGQPLISVEAFREMVADAKGNGK